MNDPLMAGEMLQTPSPLSSAMLARAFADIGRTCRRRPVVLLLGNYGNGNVGDEAILARLCELVDGLCELIVVARQPERVEHLHRVAAVRTLSSASVRAFLCADMLAIGGGGIFGSGMPLLPKLLPAVAIVARLLGKRTAYLAIGAYPDMPSGVRPLLRLSAWLSSFVSVRDLASLETLTVRILGRTASPVLVHDPAVDLTPISDHAAVERLQDLGVFVDSPPLGLSLKATPSHELNARVLRVLADALDWWCAHRTGDLVHLAFSDQGEYETVRALSDQVLANRLRQRIRHPERLHLLGPDLDPRTLKALVGSTCGMIATRLHAQIFAWSTGRPLLGLSFERKSEVFLDRVGAQRMALSDLHLPALVDWLDRLGEA